MAINFKEFFSKLISKDEPIDKVRKKIEREGRSRKSNIALIITTIVITVTFIFGFGSPTQGMIEFKNNLFKERIKNPDGSIAIPADAQSRENMTRKKPTDLYVAKVLGTMIQLNRDDEFNRNVQGILKYENFNPYQKYQYIRMYLDQEINKIIGMHNAEKMDLIITKDYLIKEIGKKQYSDANGEINYDQMRRDQEAVNKAKRQIINDLLFEIFNNDYFHGLPVSDKEIFDDYKLDNVKVTLEYMNISNSDISNDKLKDYYDKNKDKYKKYKLIRLVFNKKEDALANLSKIYNEPAKFQEFADKLKSENKLIISYDSEAQFLSDFEEQDFKNGLKNLAQGQVLNKVVQTKVGPVIVKLDSVTITDFNDPSAIEKIKNDYIVDNKDEINNSNKLKADEIYKYCKENGFSSAKQKFGVNISTLQPVQYGARGIPNLNPEKDDDLNFMAKIFKANKPDIIEPYNYGSGLMIVRILDKTQVKLDDIKPLYNDLLKRYSDEKSRNIEVDYYTNERKKIEIVDNFNYVFTYDMFFPKQENDKDKDKE